MQAFALSYVGSHRTAKGGSLTDAQEAALTEQAQNIYMELNEHGRNGWVYCQNLILNQTKAFDVAPNGRRSRRDRSKPKGTQKQHDFHRFKKLHDLETNMKDLIGEEARSIVFGLNSKLASAAWDRAEKDGKRDLFTEEKYQSEEAARYIKEAARKTHEEFKLQLKTDPNLIRRMMEKQDDSAKQRRGRKAATDDEKPKEEKKREKKNRDASPPPKKTESSKKKGKSAPPPKSSSSSSSDEDESSSASSD